MRHAARPLFWIAFSAIAWLAPQPAAAQGNTHEAGSSEIDPSDALFLELAGERAEVVRAPDGTIRAVLGAAFGGTGEPAERAVRLLQRFAPVLGLPGDVRLRVVRELDAHGLHTVQLTFEIAGISVLGVHAIVRFAPDATIDFVSVNPIPRGLGSGERRVTDAEAAALVAQRVLGQRYHVLSVVPTLFPFEDELSPVWAVEAATDIETSLELLLIDARMAAPLVRVPLLVDAMGSVFARNPVSDMNMTTDVELTDLTGARLTGRYVRTSSCNAQAGTGCSPVNHAMADGAGDFLFMPEDAYDDPFSEVNAYHHVSRVAAYFRNTHAYTWRCGASTTLEVLVNYTESPGVPYDNAAFNPGGGSSCAFLLFGEGVGGDFAYDGDVVYHEYGHAVTDAQTDILGFTSNTLGVHYLPLAINEGTSDYWAATIQGDPNVAEALRDVSGVGGRGSLRVLDNTLRCPNDLVGEGHFDGRLHGSAMWDLREAIGAADADRILYAAVGSYGSAVDLEAGAMGLRATAMTLEAAGTIAPGAVAALDTIIAARGLGDCDRIVPLDDGTTHQGYSGTSQITGTLGHRIAPNHYRIDIPADAVSLRLRIDTLTLAGDYTLILRAGIPVRVGPRNVFEHELAVGGHGELTLSESSEYVLPRCQTLYVAVEVNDLTTRGQSLFNVSAALMRSGDPSATCPERPDAGPPAGTDAGMGTDAGPETPPPAGCGCAARGATAPSVALLGLALLPFLRSRRR